MKKIIKKKTYNTDTAIEISRITFGEFGDPKGYEEILYETKKGDRFVIRFYSPLETIGGGVILDDCPQRHKRTDTGVLEALQYGINLFSPVFDFQTGDTLKLSDIVCHKNHVFSFGMCGNQHIHRSDRGSFSL